MVVPASIQSQLSLQFTVLGEDTDIEIGNEDEYARARESTAEPDVVQPAAVGAG